jgi:predicted nucleic acid-binding protein
MTDVLLDTNVLVYSLDQSSVFHTRCLKLLSDPALNFFCASKNVSEYFAVCTKLNFPYAEVLAFFNQVEQNATILFPGPVSLHHFKQLFAKYSPRGNRIYDVEVVSVMLQNGISQIATINTADFSGINEIQL